MPRDIRINYVWATAETWDNYDLATLHLAWPKKELIKQCVHAFMKVNRDFYVEAARKDWEAREMTEEDYYKTLRDQGESQLPRYKHGRPGFGVTPLDDIPELSTETSISRRYNVITLSSYNYVLLNVARIVDTGPMIQVVSRILHQHFQTYWQRTYFPQIERDNELRFS